MFRKIDNGEMKESKSQEENKDVKDQRAIHDEPFA